MNDSREQEYNNHLQNAQFADSKKAKEHYITALEIATNANNLTDIFTVKYHLAKTLIDLGENGKAEQLLIEAINSKYENFESIDSVLSPLHELTRSYLKLGHTANAQKIYEVDLENMEEQFTKNSFQYNSSLIEFAKFRLELGHQEEYLDLTEQALSYFRTNHEPMVRKVFLFVHKMTLEGLGLKEKVKEVDKELAQISQGKP